MPLPIRAPLALDLPPVEVAARCRHLPGLVFFDTALEGGEAAQLSLIAAAPREIVRGHTAADWARLRARVAARQTDTAPDDGLPNGFFFEPTIFARVEQGMRIEQEEIFGPVLSVIRVSDADEAFRVNNGVKYGLSSSLYTSNVSLAFRAFNELDNGITYINAPTIGAEAHLPFGGVKQTGNGHREGGWEVYEFYSETKVGYCDFSGALQRAQIDNYQDL